MKLVGNIAPTDDLIGFCRSKVKVTAGRPGGEDVNAGASKSISFDLR